MFVPSNTVAYAFVLAGGLALLSVLYPAAAAEFTLKSVSVEFPDSDRTLPPGPGMDVAQENCTACHSVGMIMNQPNLPKATWETEVHKMQATYKAPISAEDAVKIINYLASVKGPG